MAATTAITCLAGTGRELERQVEAALRDVSPEQIVSVSYAVSRVFGMALQHHALIVLTRPN